MRLEEYQERRILTQWIEQIWSEFGRTHAVTCCVAGLGLDLVLLASVFQAVVRVGIRS